MQSECEESYWNAMVPELIVEDIERSLEFYLLLGFSIKFRREEKKFAYLELGEAQIMLEEYSDNSWITGRLEKPFGRGINFQIDVEDMDGQLEKIKTQGIPLYEEVTESWYRAENFENGQMEFLVQDPDGYLLRFCKFIGRREISA